MKASGNNQLDSLMVNIIQPACEPIWQQAENHRDKLSNSNYKWTWTGTQQYHQYGPGVTLYFTLLKMLVIVFLLLSFYSLPALISNVKGNGVKLYNTHFGQGKSLFIKLSLANQPLKQYLNSTKSTDQQKQQLDDIEVNQLIIIINDLLISIIILFCLIYWRYKARVLVGILTKQYALPSYYTIIVDQIPNNIQHLVTEAYLREHFQQFGQIDAISIVYDYDKLLFDLKQLLQQIQNYSQLNKQTESYKIYQKIEEKFMRIKKMFDNPKKISNNTLNTNFFLPAKAFISFKNVRIADKVKYLYSEKIDQKELQLNGVIPRVRKCHVEPLSIIWQNYHLKDHIDIIKSIFIGVFMLFIMILSILTLFLVSIYLQNSIQHPFDYEAYKNSDVFKNNPHPTYYQAFSSNNKAMIYFFCSQLTYQTFRWEYYSLCNQYFTTFQQHSIFMLALSTVVFIINVLLTSLVNLLSEFRRYRTETEKRLFLIFNFFVLQFINTALVIILIRAQFGTNIDQNGVKSQGFSLLSLLRPILPKKFKLQVFSSFSRKWYIQVGNQLSYNFIFCLIINPWLILAYSYLLQYWKKWTAKRCKTQASMNLMIQNEEFNFEIFYGMILNGLYCCYFFCAGMPYFYLFGYLSMLSLFLCSKIIFHKLCCRPKMFDHNLNSIIFKMILIGIFMHQFIAIYFIFIDDIFPNRTHNYSNEPNKIAKMMLFILLSFVFLIYYFKNKVISKYIHEKISSKIQHKQSFIQNYKNQSKTRLEKNINLSRKQLVSKKFLSHSLIQINPYLRSYKLQDNPYYCSICYTLTILGLVMKQKDLQDNDPMKDGNTQEMPFRSQIQYQNLMEQNKFQTDRQFIQ